MIYKEGSLAVVVHPSVPRYQQALLQMGFTVDDAGTPESMRQHLKDRDDTWQKVFTGLGVKPE